MKRLLVLGCSALSHGELFLALNFAARCQGWATAVVAPAAQKPVADRAGMPMIPFPQTLPELAATIREHNPDALLIADWNLFCGNSPDFGKALYPLLELLDPGLRVVAHDLYDWNQRADRVDFYGQTNPHPVQIPPHLGRVSPTPYLPPTPGRYPMLDGQPRTREQQAAARAIFHFDDAPVVLIATSSWQHHWVSMPHFLVREYFPVLVANYLGLAAEQAGRVTIAHVGPEPLAGLAARSTDQVRYHHFTGQFPELLKACDAFLSMNCLATSVIQATMMRIPTACIHLDSLTGPENPTSAAERAFVTYLASVAPSYCFSVWPIGLHGFASGLLQDNPWSNAQLRLDAASPDATVQALAALFADPSTRDKLQCRQQSYFAGLCLEPACL